MSAVGASALISLGGIVISVIVSVFVAGSQWGSVTRRVQQVEQQQSNAATKSDMQAVAERLARIEGMFELRFRGEVK